MGEENIELWNIVTLCNAVRGGFRLALKGLNLTVRTVPVCPA